MKKNFRGKRIIAISIICIMIITGISVALANSNEEIFDGIGEKIKALVNTVSDKIDGVDWSDKDSVAAKENVEKNNKSKKEKNNSSHQVGVDITNTKEKEMKSISDNTESKINTEATKKINDTKALNRMENLIKDKDLSELQQLKVAKYYVDNTDSLAISALYDYMYEFFFTFNDLDEAIVRYNKGETLDNILNDYYNIENSFTAPNYENGIIEYYRDDLKLTDSQIAVIEILDYRNVISFEDFIERIENSEQFEKICEDVNLINTNAQMNSITLTQNEINSCASECNISSEEAVSKIVNAKKAKVKDSDINKYIKGNEKAGNKLKEHYIKKYVD